MGSPRGPRRRRRLRSRHDAGLRRPGSLLDQAGSWLSRGTGWRPAHHCRKLSTPSTISSTPLLDDLLAGRGAAALRGQGPPASSAAAAVGVPPGGAPGGRGCQGATAGLLGRGAASRPDAGPTGATAAAAAAGTHGTAVLGVRLTVTSFFDSSRSGWRRRPWARCIALGDSSHLLGTRLSRRGDRRVIRDGLGVWWPTAVGGPCC